MSINKKGRTDGSSIFMMSLIEYNPDLFLLTDEYVDNVKKGEEVGYQNLEEWKMYNITIRGLLIKKGFNIIEVSGNHDQLGVDHFNLKENNYLDYSFTYNRNNTRNEYDFFTRIIKISMDNMDF